MGLLLLALSACAVTAQNQMQQGSFFAAPADGGLAYNGHDWWDVRTPEIPKMQSQAALFATAIKSSPGAFAGMFTELVALVSSRPANIMQPITCTLHSCALSNMVS